MLASYLPNVSGIRSIESMYTIYGWMHGGSFAAIIQKWRKKASYCMALHLGAQPKGMQRNIDQSKFKCGLCTLRVNENFKHVLFECNELDETRQIEWRKVLTSMPEGMRIGMQSGDMPSELAPGLLVSCSGGAYIREWDGIYMTSLDFVCRMYTKRSNMHDVLLASTG